MVVTPSDTILGCSLRRFAVDFFARGLLTHTAVTCLPLRQLGFIVAFVKAGTHVRVFYLCDRHMIPAVSLYWCSG